jgi:hypothetical protein
MSRNSNRFWATVRLQSAGFIQEFLLADTTMGLESKSRRRAQPSPILRAMGKTWYMDACGILWYMGYNHPTIIQSSMGH